MARADRRRSLAERLRDENDQLRAAAQQLLFGLQEYAKKDNWTEIVSEEPGGKKQVAWIGKGEGPSVARHYLGLDQEDN